MNRTNARFSLHRMTHFALVAALFAAAPALYGQTADPATAPKEDSFLKRFSVGGRLSMLFTNLMNNEDISTSTAEPPVKTSIASASTASRLGGGATVEFALTDSFSLSADLLYRKAGYKTGTSIVEGVDDEDTDDEDERVYTTTFEGTKANYWDIPVVARLYGGSRHENRSRAFLDAGVAIRHVSNIRTFREFLCPGDVTEVDETPVIPANRNVPGVVLGGGFQFKASGGLKISPQVRLTRWLAYTFDAAPTRSGKNQVEFLIGFTF